MQEIYVNTDNKQYAFSKKYNFDGESFLLELRFNHFNESWYMTLKNDNLETIFSIRLVTLIYLLRNKRSIIGIPKGDFKVDPVQENYNENVLSFETFGTEYKLNYYSESEVVY